MQPSNNHRAEGLSRRAFIAMTGAGLVALNLPWHADAQSDPLGVFEPALIDDLAALAETLVPPDVTPGMTRDDALAWLEQMMARDRDTPIWLTRSMPTLQGGVTAALGTDARFASLTPEERHQVLAHLLEDPGTARGCELERRTMRPMMSHFFDSPRGYTVVGYEDHTGTSLAGDVTSYQGPGQMPGEGGEA